MKYSTNEITFLKGHSILSCFRHFSENVYEKIPEDVKEQESDGSTFLLFSNGSIYAFHADTEKFSIKIEKIHRGDIPPGATEVSKNNFWKSIIGYRVIEINLLYHNLESFYGVRFDFENNETIEIQYVSESYYTFDALIIRKVS